MPLAAGKKGYPVAGMPYKATGEFKFQQGHPQKGGRHMALPEQFVNRHRAGPEPLLDDISR